MQFLIVFGLIAIASFVRANDHHESLMPTGTVFKQAKMMAPPTGSGYRGDDSCALDCMMTMGTNMMSESDLMNYFEQQAKPFRFEDRFNPTLLRKYCSKITPSIDCVRPCASGTMKSVVDSALILAKYICTDPKFIEKAQCMHTVNKANKRVCDSKCASKKSTLESAMRRQPTTMRDIETLLGQTCDYLSCDAECDTAKMTADCGAETVKLFNGYYKKSMDSGKGALEAVGVQISMPSQCSRVGFIDLK